MDRPPKRKKNGRYREVAIVEMFSLVKKLLVEVRQQLPICISTHPPSPHNNLSLHLIKMKCNKRLNVGIPHNVEQNEMLFPTLVMSPRQFSFSKSFNTYYMNGYFLNNEMCLCQNKH